MSDVKCASRSDRSEVVDDGAKLIDVIRSAIVDDNTALVHLT
jgi:hypothetical protein